MKIRNFHDGFLMMDEWTLSGAAVISGNIISVEASGSASQTVFVGQKTPAPILCECESRSENAAGNNAYEYSFLIEAAFTDGTTNRLEWVPFNDGTLHYAEYAPFPKGTHDWIKRTVTLVFPKSVESLKFNILFKDHTGTACFRNAAVRDLADVPTFDAFPIDTADEEKNECMMYLRDCSQNEIKPILPPLEKKNPFEAFGVKVTPSIVSDEDSYQKLRLKLVSDGSKDMAVTFYETITCSENTVVLPDMLRRITPAVNSTVFDVTSWRTGANGLLSRFPFISVEESDDDIMSIGFSPDYPVFGRVGYSEATRMLYIAFDIALTREKPCAELEFVIFCSKKAHGFRGALDAYYSIFPDFYSARINEQGLWMPFFPISKIPSWRDFGFKFKEGAEEPAWDAKNGILTFRYTEPMTLWMRTGDSMPKDAHELATYRRDKADREDKAVLESSAMKDENGEDVAIIMDRPWCRGAVWSINSMPGIEGAETDFKIKWNSSVIEKYHTLGSTDELSGGEYIDSAEGYVTAAMDHARTHFNASSLPLSFDLDSLEPGIFKGTVVYEYIKALRKEMIVRDKFMMGNGTPGAMWFLPVLMDVAGTETDWCVEGKYTPMALDDFCFRRSACAAKPYCFLMNTDFTKFTPEMVEKYMNRCLAFGMFPGFFSANAATGQYFAQPSLYERDRPVFKKYVPLIKRVAESGWEPVTYASASESEVHLERFGEFIITALNDSDSPVMTRITVQLEHAREARSLVDGKLYVFDGDDIMLNLASGEAVALEF